MADLIIAANETADALHQVQMLILCLSVCSAVLLLICACFTPDSVHTHLAGQQASRGQLPLEPVREKMACKNTLVGEGK